MATTSRSRLGLKHQFEQARSLYQRTLRPMLLGQRNLTEAQASGQAEGVAQPQ